MDIRGKDPRDGREFVLSENVNLLAHRREWRGPLAIGGDVYVFVFNALVERQGADDELLGRVVRLAVEEFLPEVAKGELAELEVTEWDFAQAGEVLLS